MVNLVKPNTRSIIQEALAGRTVKPLSKVGQI